MRPLKGLPDGRKERAWVEVDVEALRSNHRALRERVGGGVHLLPMVKADGYGLGARRVVEALAGEEPWGFGVASVAEGRTLRNAGVKGRIVVFSPCAARDAAGLEQARLEPALTSEDALRRLADPPPGGGRTLPVHLEVDTGMGRSGLPADRAEVWAPRVRRILEASRLELASTFTHFHSAETDVGATLEQELRFRRAVKVMRKAGMDPGPLHLANSAALLRWPHMEAHVARPGLFLYGGWGGRPVASVRCRVLDVRRLPAGHPVSYGARWRAPAPVEVATLAIGYGDGLPGALSGRGRVLIGGRSAFVRGAVCMDVTVVEVPGDVRVVPGAVATVLGRDGGAEIRLEELASAAGVTPYEVLTGLGSRLPRITVGGGRDARREKG